MPITVYNPSTYQFRSGVEHRSLCATQYRIRGSFRTTKECCDEKGEGYLEIHG